jgi:hypothetical protein
MIICTFRSIAACEVTAFTFSTVPFTIEGASNPDSNYILLPHIPVITEVPVILTAPADVKKAQNLKLILKLGPA